MGSKSEEALERWSHRTKKISITPYIPKKTELSMPTLLSLYHEAISSMLATVVLHGDLISFSLPRRGDCFLVTILRADKKYRFRVRTEGQLKEYVSQINNAYLHIRTNDYTSPLELPVEP